MTRQQPLTTENYEYKLDEVRRAGIQAQIEHDRLVTLVRGEQPIQRRYLPNLGVMLSKVEKTLVRFFHLLGHEIHHLLHGHRIKGA